MYSDYAIYIRNKDGSFRDRLIDVASVNIIETLNNIGSWTIKSKTPERCPFMVGDGIVIYKNGDYYYSGPVGRISETYDGIDDIYEWTVQGVSDLDYLNRRVCYPDPGSGDTSETAYYTDSGLLSEVIERLIQKNMGILAMTPRKESLFDSVIAENEGLPISVKLRFQTLLKAVQQQLDIQKFSINTFWNADTDKLSFILRRSNDLSQLLLFSTELNSIDSYSFLASSPVGNYVISGGQGEQTERAFAYAENQESIGQWGRIEYFHDVRSVEADDLQNDADVTLQKSAEQNVGFSASMDADGSYLRYRTDWNLGDYVGIVVHNETYIRRIMQVETNLTHEMETVTPTVGTVEKGQLGKILDDINRLRSDMDYLQWAGE